MTDAITGMIGRGRSKETKNRLLDLQVLVTKYLKRVGEMPDEGLLASVLSNIIDDKTKDTFTNAEILAGYKIMAQRISATATEADTSGDRMDIGNVDVQEAKPNNGEDGSQRSLALTPVSPPMPPGSQQAPQAESPALATQGSKPPNPNIRCFICNQTGHPSFFFVR